MEIGTPAAAAIALAISMIALHILPFDHSGTMTTAQAPPAPFSNVLPDLLLLAAMEGLVVTVAFIYGHMHRVAGAGNRRISELLTFSLCTSVGLLLFFLFVMQPAGGTNDDRELSMVALHALPEAATVLFFWAMMLIYTHVSNGVVGAGGGAPVCLFAKIITLGAAAVVVSLVAMAAFYTK